MPDEIAYAMSAYRPSAEDEFFVTLLKLREKFLDKVIGFPRVAKVEASADGVFDIDAITLADA